MVVSAPTAQAPGNPAAATVEGWHLLFWALFLGLTALNVATVWVSDIVPTLDAGSHLHLITIMHNYATSLVYQHHYAEVDAIVPYLSYYKAVDWLALITDIETANRVVLSLCLAALPLSALHLLRALRHSRWLVLAVFPWALNADFFMGFFNYLMSIPIFLWILAAHVRFLRQPHWKNATLVMGLIMAMAVTHYLLWAVTLCLLPLLALVMGWRHGQRAVLRWPLREVGLCLPSILTLLPWFLSYFVLAEQARTADQAAMGGATLASRLKQLYAGNHLTPLANIDQIFDRMFNQFMYGSREIAGAFDFLLHRPGELISFVWLLGLGLWFIAVVKRRGADRGTTAVPPGMDGSGYASWALFFVTLAYFVLPQHLSRPIILYGVNFRLVEVLAILAVVALPLRPLAARPQVRVRVWAGTLLVTAAALAMPLQTAGAFMLARTEMGSIREAFASIPPDKQVLTLRARRASRYLKEQVFSGIGEYYAVMQGGYVPYSFADSSSKPVITRPQPERSLPGPIWYDHNTFDMRQQGRFFDYIVVFRALDERPGRWEQSMSTWDVIYARDRWRVFKNPEKTPWPPPTAAELAHRARIGRAVSLAMACIGLPLHDGYRARPQLLLEVLGVPQDDSRNRAPRR